MSGPGGAGAGAAGAGPGAVADGRIGLAAATAIVVSAAVGTGVFSTSGFLLRDLGSPWLVLAAWAAGGSIAALGATCYGALARRIPESGGEYVFLARTLHPAAGAVAGWLTVLGGFAAPVAAAALACAGYARVWLPPDLDPRVAGSVLVLGATALHAPSLAVGARAQAGLVVAELVVLLALVAAAAPALHAPPVTAGGAGPSAFAVALVWVSYSYAGWNTAVYVGGEVRDGPRTLPRAMAIGVAIVTALYLALNAAILFSAPAEALAGQLDVARIAAEHIGGPRAAAAVSAVIACVVAGFVSSMTLAGPHVAARMARDGYLPRVLASPPGGPPRAALALQAALALALVWTSTYESLVGVVGFALGLSTAATVFGLVRLRFREGPSLPVPGWPVVPALYLAAVLGASALTAFARPGDALLGLATLALGLCAWRLTRP